MAIQPDCPGCAFVPLARVVFTVIASVKLLAVEKSGVICPVLARATTVVRWPPPKVWLDVDEAAPMLERAVGAAVESSDRLFAVCRNEELVSVEVERGPSPRLARPAEAVESSDRFDSGTS